MVIRLPGMQAQRGPQPGPAPAWARFTRTQAADKSTSVSLQAYKPDITAYLILGRQPQAAPKQAGPARNARERNTHNSSVYVASLNRFHGKPAANLARLPVVGEIAAGQYDVTVAFQEYDCLDHEGGVVVEK